MRKTTLKLTAVRINGKRFFQVVAPRPGGGRIRRTFKDQADAKEHFELADKQIASYGAAAMMISDTLRIAAIEADKLLQPFGKTIVDASRFYLAHLKAISASATVSQAIEKLTENSKDCSVRYRRDLKYRFGRFEKEFSGRMMAEIKTGELDTFLNDLELGAVSQNTFRRRLVTLWKFASKEGWCDATVATNTRRATEEAPDEVGILTPEELTRLLNVAAKDTLAYWAIAAFTGLRASELERLEWSDVNHDHILVRARNSKTKTRRAVDIQKNLLRWLELCRGGNGKVAPLNLRTKLLADRERAGLTTWKSNCLRHSFGSYYLAVSQSADKTAYQMGNTPEIIEGHYRQVVAPADAARWWAIEPSR
jgi:integrase